MPNLTDRSVYTSKVVQRSGPLRPRKPKVTDDSVEVKTPVTKKLLGRSPTKPKKPIVEDVDSDSSEASSDEMKPNISAINVQAQECKQLGKLVDLKVEHDGMHDDKNISKIEYVEVRY